MGVGVGEGGGEEGVRTVVALCREKGFGTGEAKEKRRLKEKEREEKALTMSNVQRLKRVTRKWREKGG